MLRLGEPPCLPDLCPLFRPSLFIKPSSLKSSTPNHHPYPCPTSGPIPSESQSGSEGNTGDQQPGQRCSAIHLIVIQGWESGLPQRSQEGLTEDQAVLRILPEWSAPFIQLEILTKHVTFRVDFTYL